MNPTFPGRPAGVAIWPAARAPCLAVEGAEDNLQQGEADLLALRPDINDVVILLAASGATPYVLGALLARARPAP